MGFIDGLEKLKEMDDASEAKQKQESDEAWKSVFGENYKKWRTIVTACVIVVFVGGLFGFYAYHFNKQENYQKLVQTMIRNKDYNEALRQLDNISDRGKKSDSASELMKALIMDGETEQAKALFAWAISADHGKPLENAVGLQVSLITHLRSLGLDKDVEAIQSIDCSSTLW